MTKRIKQLRAIEGFSQKDLAEVFGVSQTTISRWENNTNMLNAEILLDLSDFFGVSVDYLLGVSDTPKSRDFTRERLD